MKYMYMYRGKWTKGGDRVMRLYMNMHMYMQLNNKVHVHVHVCVLTASSLSFLNPVRQATTPSIVQEYTGLFLSMRD